ncbi:MAG: substrate-binding domain-containing protein, partial [Gemmatimonadales bacterium]
MMLKQSLVAAASLLLATPLAAQTLTGAGATFPNPIYPKWFDAYSKQTGVRINYQSIGSGGGIRQFTEGTVDFGATDGPMNESQ